MGGWHPESRLCFWKGPLPQKLPPGLPPSHLPAHRGPPPPPPCGRPQMRVCPGRATSSRAMSKLHPATPHLCDPCDPCHSPPLWPVTTVTLTLRSIFRTVMHGSASRTRAPAFCMSAFRQLPGPSPQPWKSNPTAGGGAGPHHTARWDPGARLSLPAPPPTSGLKKHNFN